MRTGRGARLAATRGVLDHCARLLGRHIGGSRTAGRRDQTARFSLQDEDGAAILVAPSGLRRPLRRDGCRFEALRQGWSSEEVHHAFEPIIIIPLRHQNGDLACWIVDALNETYFEPIGHLPPPVSQDLRLASRRLLDQAHGGDKDARDAWDRLPRRIRLDLLAEAQAEASWAPDGLIDRLAASNGASHPGDRLVVHTNEGQFSVVLPGGWELPILLGGKVLQSPDLAPGWTAVTLYRDFAPSYLLELRHADGAGAAWMLDRQLRQVGDVWRPSTMAEVLVRDAAPVMNRHLASVLALQGPGADPVVERYLALDPTVRHALIAHSGGCIRPPLSPLSAQRMPRTFALDLAGKDGAAILLSRDAVERAVTADLHQHTLRAIRRGRLEWPSPVDASLARLSGIFTLDDYVFVYQFTDRHGVDFMLVAGDRSARPIGLIVPSANLFLFHEQPGWTHDDWLRRERGGDFWCLLVRHVNQYAAEVAGRSRGAAAVAVNVLLSNVHIGHHLWNDLTGLEALCDAVPPADLPKTMILGAADLRAELFGPIDTLFPSLSSHVDRSLPDVDAFIRWTYAHDVWPCRITRERVTARLRERVVGALDASLDPQTRRDCLDRSGSAPGAPVIVFGLRVEDRTFTDLEAFCAAFIGFTADRHPGATIVFDGHNSGPNDGGIIRGMAYGLAERAPEDVEADLVRRLAERFAHAPVRIVGTTGQSIAASLAWCRSADAAFAIWGAGLAKYRWLANLPTMMISTRENLLTRPDLAIYHDPRYVEDPKPYLLADPDWITDTGTAGALATGHVQGGRGCFTADPALVLPAFDAFLRRVRASAD